MRFLFTRVFLPLVVLAMTAWIILAFWFDGPQSQPLAIVLIAVFILATMMLFTKVRPLWKASASYLFLFGFVLVWWFSIEPSNDREWQRNVANLPRAEFDGDIVTIHNFRNFDYSSENDFTELWESRTYDLSQLRGVDMFLSYWGSPWIAHTIASWDFGNGNHLAISIETRKEKGEHYSSIGGFFRQYELYYVVADERDIIRLRTNYRGEKVRLYHLKASVELARGVLLRYLEELNNLATRPRWYNALTHNCTTMIQHHIDQVAPGDPFDWRMIVNGRIDELGYERNNIDTSLPFEELRLRSEIGEVANAADSDPAFSLRIREGLPGGT